MFKIILIMTLLIGGCNISTNQLQPPIEEKEVVAKHEPWPEGEKEYWIARYFFTMAADPRVQQIMLPRDAYEIVVCTVNKYEEEHSWEWFTMFLHDNRILQPEIEQYVYDTTRVCAVMQKAKTDAKKPLDVKESI
tara:strand:+ start:155 stop:559 length:405 start_codon:yes stop_codon:yes gene_type:complete